MDVVREGSTAYLTVTFRDKSGAAQAPVSATWEVHDVKSGAELKAPTALSVAASVEITLPPAVNAIVNEADSKGWEHRRVTVKAQYGAGDAVNDEYVYQVLKLSAVP